MSPVSKSECPSSVKIIGFAAIEVCVIEINLPTELLPSVTVESSSTLYSTTSVVPPLSICFSFSAVLCSLKYGSPDALPLKLILPAVPVPTAPVNRI